MSTERRDLLIEIGTEELPPKALRVLELAFAEGLRSGLAERGLAHGALRSFATPRRLAVAVRGLEVRERDQSIVKRGPPLSAAREAGGGWSRAATAFAAANGIAPEALEARQEAKGEFLYFVGTRAGAETQSLLPALLERALATLPIPRLMRWGAGNAEFVRPVHWVLLLFGREVIPLRLFEIDSGNQTRGHRFLAPRPLRIATPASYERTLGSRGRVIADFSTRRERVRAQVLALAAEVTGSADARAVFDEPLLEEVTALVEWPVALAGRFEERFLALPREVLVSTLQEHQRYFPVEDAGGALTPWFITVCNIESREPERVRAGNERVVRPRLADAAFFYAQDRRAPLAAFVPLLETVTFQARLGSLAAKTLRVTELAAEIAALIGGDPALARRAAALSKCDLVSAMVGEFPDLQGIMGRYYALADGEPREVAAALREQYLPRAAGDALPATPTGAALALADKLDTLAGIFAIGQKPTGTKDPFGLRRAAIGVLRILLEGGHDLDLAALLARAAGLQPEVGERPSGEPGADVVDYVLERLRGWFLEYGTEPGPEGRVTTEMFDAVLATAPRSPLDFRARLRALRGFLALPQAASLTAAHKRIANLLRKSAEAAPLGAVDPAALREPAEIALQAALTERGARVEAAIAARAYGEALGLLAELRPEVDAFFEAVMVMDPDPRLRANRLALLVGLQRLFGGVADLARLPG
jgi:glycyl-tRNA synthetase beta chain